MSDERAVEVLGASVCGRHFGVSTNDSPAAEMVVKQEGVVLLEALRAEGYEIHTPEVCVDRALTALRSALTTDKPPIRLTSDDVPVGGEG